jgi:ClpP class serine protease
MNPLVDMDKAAVALVQESLTSIHLNFIGWVKSRRPLITKEAEPDVLSGRVYVGQESVDVGLADRVATLTEILQEWYPQEWEDLKLVEVKRKYDGSILGLLGKLASGVVGLLRATNSLMRNKNFFMVQSGIQALMGTSGGISRSGF